MQTAIQIHALLLEFGIVLPLGARGIKHVTDIVMKTSADLPHAARRILSVQHEHYRYLAELIVGLDGQIGAQAKADALTSRLMTIPGIGPITASQLATDAGKAQRYRSALHFAVSLGLVPRQHSTSGKSKLLGISKRGGQIAAAVTGAVRSGGDAERRQMEKSGGAVDAAVDDTTALECSGLCVDQQAGTDRMGSASEGRGVSSDTPMLPEGK